MISGKFIKTSFIYTMGGALPMLASFILLPFYINSLSVNDFGILALYISITLLLQIVASFSFESYIGVHYFEYKNEPNKLKVFVGTIIWYLFLVGIILTLFSILSGDYIFKTILKNSSLVFWPYGFMCVITAIFNAFFKVYTNFLIYKEKEIQFIIANTLNLVLTVSISLIGLNLYPHLIIGPMYGRLLSGAGIFLFAFFFLVKEYGLKFDKNLTKSILRFCLPFFLYQILAWVVANIDRFIINDYLSAADVAIFDLSLKFILLIEFVQNGLSAVINPKIYSRWSEDSSKISSQEINRYYNGFTAFNLIILPLFVLAVIIFIPLLIKGKAYEQSFIFLPILTAGYITRGLYYMYLSPIIFFKRTKMLPWVFFFSAIIQIIASIVLIKIIGLTGAVIANVMSKIFQIAFLYFANKKQNQISFNKLKLIFLPSVYLLMSVFVFFFIPSKYLIQSCIAILILNTLLIAIVYRNETKLFLKQII